MPLKILPIRIRIHIQSKNSNWMDIPIRIHPIFLRIPFANDSWIHSVFNSLSNKR